MPDIAVLDPQQTETVLAGHRFGKTSSLLAQISDRLTEVVDTESSVWVTGLTDSSINSLRTRMYRRDIAITVRKVTRLGDVKGHVITARKISPEEQG